MTVTSCKKTDLDIVPIDDYVSVVRTETGTIAYGASGIYVLSGYARGAGNKKYNPGQLIGFNKYGYFSLDKFMQKHPISALPEVKTAADSQRSWLDKLIRRSTNAGR
jgi:hypothetical protein